MTPTEIQLVFRAFYARVLEPSPEDLSRCAALAMRGFLTPIQDGHRLGYSVARLGYNFVQSYLWKSKL